MRISATDPVVVLSAISVSAKDPGGIIKVSAIVIVPVGPTDPDIELMVTLQVERL